MCSAVEMSGILSAIIRIVLTVKAADSPHQVVRLPTAYAHLSRLIDMRPRGGPLASVGLIF
jgi:hypothetical protein